jgi:hypothetical protein
LNCVDLPPTSLLIAVGCVLFLVGAALGYGVSWWQARALRQENEKLHSLMSEQRKTYQEVIREWKRIAEDALARQAKPSLLHRFLDWIDMCLLRLMGY